jgi:hypothetical protein
MRWKSWLRDLNCVTCSPDGESVAPVLFVVRAGIQSNTRSWFILRLMELFPLKLRWMVKVKFLFDNFVFKCISSRLSGGGDTRLGSWLRHCVTTRIVAVGSPVRSLDF